MYKIVDKRFFSPQVACIEIEAPRIARARKAGHFVIVRVDERSERMPLTIADADTDRGTITLVVQNVGVSSGKLCQKEPGECLHDVVGPLGKATDIRCFGTVVCACGGVGAAPMLPIAKALKKAGNRVVTVLAARTAELIILKEQLAECSDELIVMTDDGSMGQQGVVTVGVEQVAEREHVDKCVTIGPAIMMKFVALTTAKYGIPTDASLNTIMVDGTGMCGACRVTVGGKTRFVCVEGPEFDAHAVDFDELLSRLRSYKPEEATANELYKESQRQLTGKERAAIERVKMPELAPETRIHSLRDEVNQGLSYEQAVTEAHRCLNCKNPTCVEGCPVHIEIPRFIKHLEKGEVAKAAAVIRESSSLPAVCGRVCPQEKQCEAHCIHLKMGHEAVAIGYLERFAADNAAAETVKAEKKNGRKVAIVGSGPAGLSCAGDLAKWGYDVTVFEALHEIGGVLKYGIPEFRLPNRIVDKEIDNLKQTGVSFETDTIIGKTLTTEDLYEAGYEAVFVGSGAGLPRFMGIEGENLNGVMSCNEYLTRVNLMDASNANNDTPLLHGRRVAVIGGGNTAMDAVRTAKRLGAEKAMIVYRRSEEEMPARIEEVRHAKEEGIEFMTLHNPIAYKADEQGRVKEAVLQVMTLGEPDESGRRSPVEVEGKTVTIEVDMVIVAVGVSPNPIIPQSVEGLNISKKGTIVVEDDTLQSSIPTLFAGGDIVRGGATVILAMSDGRKAAKAIDEYLQNKNKQQRL
ncbi:MAG: bifunctional dihydroorotate dehydrogenase B NAD binding subunit/NADPH-dependent glutamate synthase [Paludibacteraceae bacterium]|nr:bifunctional dihydroorotate dehydrogenase B NAD binding subunit/NADPH-dependent glutamate synthase [Paludibacteraceae bacterium]